MLQLYTVKKKLKAVITFVDFKKAFDSIHRGKLMEILKAYGVPEKIVSAVDILYRDTVASFEARRRDRLL